MTRKPARGGDAFEGLAELERRLGHTFANPALARQALTHRSYGTPNNERLEFLGDSLLGCAVATLLYERYPNLPEGDLTRMRAALVNNHTSLPSVAACLRAVSRIVEAPPCVMALRTRLSTASRSPPDQPQIAPMASSLCTTTSTSPALAFSRATRSSMSVTSISSRSSTCAS